MDITLLQGILLAVLAFVVAIDLNLEGFFIFRPIIVCTLAGAILGDLKTGLMAGGLAELSFAGLTPVGGTVPPDAVMTSIMTVVIAITTNQNVATALAIAIPFGLLMQYLVSILYSLTSFANPIVDKYAKKGEVDRIVHLGITMVFVFSLMYATIAFLSTYVAQDAMSTMVNAMPQFLIHGFQIAGGLIPAVGFALLLNVMLKNRYLGYLLAGFIFVCFIPFGNVLPAAVMGLAFALTDYYRNASEVKEEEGDATNEGI